MGRLADPTLTPGSRLGLKLQRVVLATVWRKPEQWQALMKYRTVSFLRVLSGEAMRRSQIGTTSEGRADGTPRWIECS